jgi:hypothetical protein
MLPSVSASNLEKKFMEFYREAASAVWFAEMCPGLAPSLNRASVLTLSAVYPFKGRLNKFPELHWPYLRFFRL